MATYPGYVRAVSRSTRITDYSGDYQYPREQAPLHKQLITIAFHTQLCQVCVIQKAIG